MQLDDEYLQQAEFRARKFSGAYTGTSGTLAADVLRCIANIQAQRQEIAKMQKHFEEANAEIRAAVEARNAAKEQQGCCEGSPMSCKSEPESNGFPIDENWILRGAEQLKQSKELPQQRLVGDGILAADTGLPAADRLLVDALDVIRQRRMTYGGPRHHFARTVGAINAIFASKLREPLTISDWAQIMILDKLSRNQGDNKTPDTPIDLAGYAACLAECEGP
jgi:Domain of unknown function (DUF6378)